MKRHRVVLVLLAIAGLATLQPLAEAQSAGKTDSTPAAATSLVTSTPEAPSAYVRPTNKTKLHNYLFDTFGPHPIVGAAIAAGINQADSTPPEWGQGAEGYGKRFGSDFGIAAVATTARYALAAAFNEDTLYYRCECKGVLRRFGHAVISTVTARRSEDGHRVVSFPAIVAPYAGTMTAVYGWYPSRYNAKDAFRMGNYSLLAYAGGNVALEFIYSGPHSLLSKIHLKNPHGAPDPGSKH